MIFFKFKSYRILRWASAFPSTLLSNWQLHLAGIDEKSFQHWAINIFWGYPRFYNVHQNLWITLLHLENPSLLLLINGMCGWSQVNSSLKPSINKISFCFSIGSSYLYIYVFDGWSPLPQKTNPPFGIPLPKISNKFLPILHLTNSNTASFKTSFIRIVR